MPTIKLEAGEVEPNKAALDRAVQEVGMSIDALRNSSSPDDQLSVRALRETLVTLHRLRDKVNSIKPPQTIVLGSVYVGNITEAVEDEAYFLGVWSPGHGLPEFHVEFIEVHTVDGVQCPVRDPHGRYDELCDLITGGAGAFQVVKIPQGQCIPAGDYVVHIFPFSE